MLAAASIYGYQRFRELRISRNAALERERIESQYEVLKAQINPHLLFNSFNTLASIVEEDSQLAIEYIEKLSDYYRSIIQFRNQKMISLGEELILIDDFTYLLKRRFGKNLQVIKQIESTDSYIPPLTLQMLVENAVKHNVISRQKPLTIVIRTEKDDYLVVSNNLQPKKSEEPSTRFGLQNIQTRFELLTKKKVIIEDHGEHFSVSIPLLK
jgi:LytS/YehU family sensor histidine kinase